MKKISITNTVRQCHKLVLQFESNQKIYNDLFIKDANEFYIIYTKLKTMLAELQQSIKLVIASYKNMSKAVLKQEITGQKNQMAYYAQIVESVELGCNKTIVKDIYYILDVEKQPVLKQSNEIKSDTSLKIDPSN